jgi:hypothetical protein
MSAAIFLRLFSYLLSNLHYQYGLFLKNYYSLPVYEQYN